MRDPSRARSDGTVGSVGLVLVIALALGACGSSSGTSSPPPSARSLVETALNNAAEGAWVHETVSTHAKAGASPAHTLVMNNEIGKTEGRQIIDVDGAHAMVMVIGIEVYIEGNTPAIANYFQLTKTDPQRFAGRWISISQNDPGYATLSAAVTLKSDFSHVSLNGPLKEGTVVVIDGQKALPISGYTAGPSAGENVPATLYATATGKVLPIEFRASNSQLLEVISWSDWGHAVSLVAPTGAAPISGLGG